MKMKNKNKRFILSAVMVFMLIFTVGCKQETEVLKIAIYPTGTTSESYLLTLYDSAKLECVLGFRTSEQINSIKDIKKIDKKSETLLKSDESDEIIELTKKIIKEYQPEDTDTFTDSWNIRIIYNDQIYEVCYSSPSCPEEVELLVDKVSKISPVKIDMHGWA